ncbi:MAG: FimV/HubP family polar landmark protein [Woeseiaceae bacterium]
MSRRLTHISLVLVLLLASEAWAIGLGDIELDSALNEPLRAEISLLSATPDELASLTVMLASSETFDRYGIDRPFYLQDIEFNVVNDARGAVVQLRSRQAMTEPFLTFLVEASWPSGRLLREYTVLLDPPTFAPPAAQQAPAVTAPSRSTPADSGRIEQPRAAQPEPSVTESPPRASAPRSRPSQPSSSPAVDNRPFDASAGGDYVVQRNETLWGIASRVRPDSRLTMNQTMLAIFEANRDAFGGNINMLRAGAALRIPSADEIVSISSGNAFQEVKRQNEAWSSGSGFTAPPVTEETRPSLTLVPPDEEPEGLVYDDDLVTSEPLSREEELEQRIDELESADVPDQPSLIEIRDNELAQLRQELAEIRGEVYEPPVEVSDDPFVDEADDEAMDDEIGVDDLMSDDELIADDEMVEDAVDDAEADDTVAEPTVSRPAPVSEPGLVDQILGALTSIWAGIAAALIVVVGLLVWFMRRDSDDEGDSAPWEALDSEEMREDTLTTTESMRAPTAEEAFVVVEQDAGLRPQAEDATAEISIADGSGEFGSLEDTFSSETAVNLDQTDPIAEADFHMAYGLYDQAADLINGALETSPEDTGLMSKLCEIYFVWGNRDAFIDAAGKLKALVGGGEGPEWDKIVIMGQQIAADNEMFAGAGVAGATKAVDLAFDADGDDAGALDMDFGAAAGDDSGAIDLGADDGGDDGVDFFFEEETAGGDLDLDAEPTAESPTIAATGTARTLEMPSQDDATAESTVESPTIEQPAEQPIGEVDATSELPSLDESLGQAIADTGGDSAATAEINLDDLDLGIDDLAETELASMDDLDETGTNEALTDVFTDTGSVTGKNPEIDPNATGVREGLDLGEIFDLDATGEMNLAADETGRSPLLDASEDDETGETEVDIDDSLLDATGLTQVLSDDLAVDTGVHLGGDVLGDDEATQLAPLDEDDDDFDFAKTEALPSDAFPAPEADETGEMPAMPEGDEDLDLDDLTAALKVSETGDTIEQLRDDSTVEQPRPSISGQTAEVPTMSLGPEEMSDDLHDARTMTEVGTKLDLARAYVDMGDPAGARSILEEVLDEGDEGQRQQAQQLLDSLPS